MVCLNNASKSDTQTNTTTNPDGSTTTTSTTENNVKGSGSSTTTTTTSADGNSTTTTTWTYGNSSGSGDGSGDDAAGDSWTVGEGGSFEGQGDALDAAKQGLTDAIAQVRLEASALLQNFGSTSSSLPCFTLPLPGGSKTICLSDFEAELTIVGLAILFLSLLIALAIILG